MTYYAQINSHNILTGIDKSIKIIDEYGSSDVQNIEVSEEVYNNARRYGDNYYIYSNDKIIANPNYNEEQRQKKQEKINQLTMTALDFINFLKQAGLTDEMIEIYLNNNLNVKHQLQFCQNVYCGVAKQIFTEPITIGNVTITADMVESAFRVKHGVLPDKEIVE